MQSNTVESIVLAVFDTQQKGPGWYTRTYVVKAGSGARYSRTGRILESFADQGSVLCSDLEAGPNLGGETDKADTCSSYITFIKAHPNSVPVLDRETNKVNTGSSSITPLKVKQYFWKLQQTLPVVKQWHPTLCHTSFSSESSALVSKIKKNPLCSFPI